MVEGVLAIWLNTVTSGVMVYVMANVLVSASFLIFSHYFLTIEVSSRRRVLWGIVTIPWLASSAIALYFMYTLTLFSTVDINKFAHWHHMIAFNWYSWHGATLAGASLLLSVVIYSRVRQLRFHRQQLSLLTDYATPLGNKLYEIDSPSPNAFTSGFVNKRCFITSAMKQATSADEQAVILLHEQAHLDKNDPLKKWLFSLFSAFFIPLVARKLKLHMTLAMEQDADNAVQRQNFSSTFIASTLIKVTRLNAKNSELSDNELVANFGANVLEQRVYFLLGQLNLKPINKSIALLLVLLMVAICFTTVDGIHHVVESVFSH